LAGQDTSFGLILFDLDYFKRYNNYYGHLQGDDCLKEIAAALNAVLKSFGAMLYRYGGEEFAVVIPRKDQQACAAIAQEVLKEIEALQIPHATSSCSRFVTISIGLCSVSGVYEPEERGHSSGRRCFVQSQAGRAQWCGEQCALKVIDGFSQRC
jgi:diguanylate cyclase (GGDEF)-like protein